MAKAQAKVLVQARVAASTKRKLAILAAASDRKPATYIALVLKDHADNVDPRTLKALSRAWRGVPESRSTVVSRKDGPK